MHIISMGWSLIIQVFNKVRKVYRKAMLDLFETKGNWKIKIYVSQTSDPMMWKENILQHQWDYPETCPQLQS